MFASIFLLFFVSSAVLLSEGQVTDTVVGCGGFIRWRSSDVKSDIDYRKLKVNLHLEESGSLKEVTEVLPNGAFSVPLYDRGLFRLKLYSPKGWHMEPADGYLLDLQKNPEVCTNDFNFELLGFSIIGQVVTYGLKTGPADLVVQLASAPKTFVMHTRTLIGGHFTIGPVTPGEYTLMVSDGEQILPEHIRAKQSVVVVSDNVVLEKPVVLMGHFVRGYVVDFTEQSLPGVVVYLVANNSVTNVDCAEVTQKKIKLPSIVTDFAKSVCETTTDMFGQFSFNRLPGGDYILIPRYNLSVGVNESTAAVEFRFDPPFLAISVAHTDVQLGSQTFKAVSFQLRPGRVTWPNGQAIDRARISIRDAHHRFVSDQNGFYQVGFVNPQVYTIHVDADDAEFADLTTRFAPEMVHLPNFQPTKLSLCGQLAITEDLLKIANQLEATIYMKEVKSGEVTHTDARFVSGGLRFCAFLIPGRYDVRPEVHCGDAAAEHAYFAPASQVVDLSAGPVSNVTFSQFTAKLSGRVRCLTSCSMAARPLIVELSPVHRNNTLLGVRQIPLEVDPKAIKIGYFTFQNIHPGDYRISISFHEKDDVLPTDGWCWSQADGVNTESRIIHVRQTNLDWKREPSLDFIQTGFAVRVLYTPSEAINATQSPDLILSASGKKTNEVKNVTNETTQLHWKLDKFASKICFPSPGMVYVLTVASPCAKLNAPSPAQIRPDSDCMLALSRSPVVNLTVAQLPLQIILSHTHPFVPMDRAVLTRNPITIDVTQTIGHSNLGKTQKVLAKWSNATSQGAKSPPIAEVLHWIDAQSSVHITPRMTSAIPRRWFYTHLMRTDTVIMNPGETAVASEPFLPAEFHFVSSLSTIPEMINPPMHPVDFQRCAAMYHANLTIRFSLELGVTLFGETHPAVKKVEVKLFPIPGSTHLINRTENNSLMMNAMDDISGNGSATSSPIEVVLTDVDGTFLFGPVPIQAIPNSDETEPSFYRLPANPTDWYTVELSKPGYEFTPQPQSSDVSRSEIPNWQFKAIKLSLVEVSVRTTNNGTLFEPLQGVLISIIGEGHRGNQFTDKSGRAHFVGLAPGQYYLRPMMKEYLFTIIKPKPEMAGQASPITVSEGVSVFVEVVAKRVAFSLSGLVTSLAKLPEANVLIEAEWIPHPTEDLVLTRFPTSENITCQLGVDGSVNVPGEQAWTNATGHFQIRGLLPGCMYAVSVRTSNVLTDPITRGSAVSSELEKIRSSLVERAIPKTIYVLMAPYDASGVSFIAMRPLFMQTLTASVDTSDEFLSSLRLTLFPLDRSDQPLVKHDFSVDSMLFMLTGPRLAPLVGSDHVLRLESVLDPNFYTNIDSQDAVLRLRPGKNEHIQFSFRPKLRSVSPDSSFSRTEF